MGEEKNPIKNLEGWLSCYEHFLSNSLSVSSGFSNMLVITVLWKIEHGGIWWIDSLQYIFLSLLFSWLQQPFFLNFVHEPVKHCRSWRWLASLLWLTSFYSAALGREHWSRIKDPYMSNLFCISVPHSQFIFFLQTNTSVLKNDPLILFIPSCSFFTTVSGGTSYTIHRSETWDSSVQWLLTVQLPHRFCFCLSAKGLRMFYRTAVNF